MNKRETETELMYDKLLKIKTSGRDDSDSDYINYPYEPTPYPVLERLANSGYIRKQNLVLDYGCGKGRVDFYLSYQIGCHSLGVEYNERIYEAALKNKNTSVSGKKAAFVCEDAGTFEVVAEADRFFFFNPFSIEILRKVISRITDSWYEKNRPIYLFFYYPSDEYVSFLMTQDLLMFEDEIDVRDLFEGEDLRERILIFSMGI